MLTYLGYYHVSGGDQTEGTVQIIRSFGEPVSTAVSEGVADWIKVHERPVVYAFNDRTIGDIFSERGSAAILFHNPQAGEALVAAFTDAATVWRVEKQKPLIFTDIPVCLSSCRSVESTTVAFRSTSKSMCTSQPSS
jgi:hypothetical protein